MPVPASGGGWGHVSVEGARQFIADAEKMCEHGMIPEALLHTAGWHVIPACGRIVLSDWSQLCRLEKGAEMRIMENVRRELHSRGLV